MDKHKAKEEEQEHGHGPVRVHEGHLHDEYQGAWKVAISQGVASRSNLQRQAVCFGNQKFAVFVVCQTELHLLLHPSSSKLLQVTHSYPCTTACKHHNTKMHKALLCTMPAFNIPYRPATVFAMAC